MVQNGVYRGRQDTENRGYTTKESTLRLLYSIRAFLHKFSSRPWSIASVFKSGWHARDLRNSSSTILVH